MGNNKLKFFIKLLSLIFLSIGIFLHISALYAQQTSNVSIDMFNLKPSQEKREFGAIDFLIKACDNKTRENLSANLNYGDGTTEDFTIPCNELVIKTHTYKNSGTFKITLTLKNSFGKTKIKSIDFDLKNFPPIIEKFSISPLSNLEKGGNVLFEVSFCDPNFDLIEAKLLPGDGNIIPLDLQDICGEVLYSYSYKNQGIFRPVIEIKDSRGQIIKKELKVNIGSVEEAGEQVLDLRGKVVKSRQTGKTYYITFSGRRKQHPNMEVFLSYGNKPEDLIEVNDSEIFKYPPVKLIHLENEEIFRTFLLENGIKRFITKTALKRLGLENEPIVPVNLKEFITYPTGAPIYK